MAIEQKAIIILPTKNEVQSIEEMIKRIARLRISFFVIDEQSTDGTFEITKKFGVKIYQRKGKGKGCGMIEGLEIADKQGYNVAVFIDCDSTYPVEIIPKMFEFMPEYDMVVGTRSANSINFSHALGNKIHTFLINLLFSARLHDINSGLRAVKVKKFVNILNAKGFDIEAQITVKALKKGYKIKEIPIEYKKRQGKSKILYRDGLIILWNIIKERFLS